MSKRRSIARTLFDVRVFDKAKVEVFELFNSVKRNKKVDKRKIIRSTNFRRKTNFFSFYVVTSKFSVDESIKRMKKTID